jgi:hypothetical protein
MMTTPSLVIRKNRKNLPRNWMRSGYKDCVSKSFVFTVISVLFWGFFIATSSWQGASIHTPPPNPAVSAGWGGEIYNMEEA